jgi:hypothetical protein
LPTITSTPTRPAWASVFWADRYILTSGECTTLYWNVENVTAVYLDGVPTTGKDSRVMCPSQTTTYVLRVVSSAGTQDRSVTITVRSADQAAVEFTADRYEIVKGQCIILSWRTSNVTAVYLNGEGVAGEASKKVCPETTAQYELRVETGSDTPTIKTLTINVLAAEKIAMRFWAEQYTFQSGNCTTLHWNVQDVTAVYFAGATSGDPEGVAGVGTRQVCPTGTQSYTLTAEASGDRKQSKRITLQVEEPVLAANEVIAQGVINEVNFVTALDPNASTPQPGYQVVVDGINPLFSGTSSCCQAVVKLLIPQTVAELAEGPVDWPINPGQLIEFRATCQNSTCDPTGGPQTYARLRSD